MGVAVWIGVAVGMGAEMLKLCLSYGYHMIVSGGDVPFLANTSKSTSAEAREIRRVSSRLMGSRRGWGFEPGKLSLMFAPVWGEAAESPELRSRTPMGDLPSIRPR